MGKSGLMNLLHEIRELIFNFCVIDAINQSKTAREKATGIRPGVTNCALALWPEPSGEKKLIIEGIDNLPLLFTNKEIFTQVSKLVYSNFSELMISPQYFLHTNENPDSRWDEQIQSLLRQKMARISGWKNGVIKIHMPSLAEVLHDLESNGDKFAKTLSHNA